MMMMMMMMVMMTMMMQALGFRVSGLVFRVIVTMKDNRDHIRPMTFLPYPFSRVGCPPKSDPCQYSDNPYMENSSEYEKHT